MAARSHSSSTSLGRLAALAALSLSAAVHATAPASCGAAVAPDAAMRRLNDLRLRGATCHRGAAAAAERLTAAPLVWNERLAQAADTQAHEMARLERMSHRDSLNRSLSERLRLAGYSLGTAVENVAVGYPSLDDVVDAWVESEGHCENLMNAAMVEFGLACVDAGFGPAAEEQRYWALVLGAPTRRR